MSDTDSTNTPPPPSTTGKPEEAPGTPGQPGPAAATPEKRAADAAPRYLKENDTALGLAWRVVVGRYRAMRDKASRDFMRRTLRIGVSARIFHPEPGSTGLRSKNL